MSRNSLDPNKPHKGKYVVPQVVEPSEVAYVPCYIWMHDGESGNAYELPAAFPHTWFAVDGKYVRHPHGGFDRWFTTADNVINDGQSACVYY